MNTASGSYMSWACGNTSSTFGKKGTRKAVHCSGLDASILPLKCVCNVKTMSMIAGDLDENVGEDPGVG